MKTKEIKIKVSLEKEGVLKSIMDNSEQNEELRKVDTVLSVLLNNSCRGYCVTNLEARVLGIDRGSILSSVLSKYKEYILKDL